MHDTFQVSCWTELQILSGSFTISCHFLAKCRFFYTENKQTGQLIFLFLVTLTIKRKMKNGMNRTLPFCEILKVHFENVISFLTCNLLHIRRHALLISLDFPFSYLFEVVKISLIYQYCFAFLTQSFIIRLIQLLVILCPHFV